MTGMPIDRAAVLAGRVSGDSTVAYALAYARAIEAADRIEIPGRAVWLRALMAELERLANHFGDIGAICNDAAFAMMHAQCGHLREQVLRVADRCFGHRLMMDQVVPGGVRRDLQREGDETVRALVIECRAALSRAGRALRQHRITAGPHRRHRHPVGCARAPIRLRGLYRPCFGATLRRETHAGLSALRCAPVRRAAARRRRRGRPRSGSASARSSKACRWSSRSCTGFRPGPSASRCHARPQAMRAKAMALVEGFRGDVLVWLRIAPTAASRAATCATLRGSSGRCSRPPSKATSSPTSRYATSRSTAPTRAMTSSGIDACVGCYSRAWCTVR